MSARKEPFFWCPDIRRSGQVTCPEDYASLWAGAEAGALRGEASAEYLRSRVAIPSLLSARPDVRLIAMIRNPVEIVASLHSNLLLGLQENVADLEAAWRLQEQRRQGVSLPPRCAERDVLQYAAYGAIGDQLERFLDSVPARQRLVVVYDDFRDDPREQYRRVLELLGLSDDEPDSFPRVHPNRALRSARLASWHRALARRLGPFHRHVGAGMRALGIRPSAWLDRVNVRTAPREPLRAHFEAELIAAFLPQVEKVERLLDRDFTAWKVPAAHFAPASG